MRGSSAVISLTLVQQEKPTDNVYILYSIELNLMLPSKSQSRIPQIGPWCHHHSSQCGFFFLVASLQTSLIVITSSRMIAGRSLSNHIRTMNRLVQGGWLSYVFFQLDSGLATLGLVTGFLSAGNERRRLQSHCFVSPPCTTK